MSAPHILATGRCLPARVVTNEEISRRVDTSDEWVFSRTGIHERRFCTTETGVDLAEGAARRALERAGIAPEEVGVCLVATFTPHYATPSTACLLQQRLGLREDTVCFDLNAACAGFLYGLKTAHALLDGCARPYALLVSSEVISRVTNMEDRNTCVLFGDGAGAAVLEWNEERAGILSSFIVNEDDITNALTCANAFDAPQPFDKDGISLEAAAAGDPALPRTDEEIGTRELVEAGRPRQVLYMDGPKVFKFAAEAMTTAVRQAVERAGITLDDVACIVPHQANERIIKYAAKKLGRPMDFFQLSIAHTGNSSAASVPMALADAYEQGRIQRGDKVVVVAFGGGFTSGAVVFEA